MKKKIIASAILASLFASPAAFSNEKAELRKILEERLKPTGLEVGSIHDLPLDGFYEVYIDESYLYMSKDAKWLLKGELIDMENAVSITKEREYDRAIENIQAFGEENLATFKAKDEKAMAYVFTDITCGYCQKLHKDIPYLNEHGLTIKYVPYPRSGTTGAGFELLSLAWCADDRQKAITDLKSESNLAQYMNINVTEECKNIVRDGYMAGARSGVKGTPRIFIDNRVLIPGYPDKDQLLKMAEIE